MARTFRMARTLCLLTRNSGRPGELKIFLALNVIANDFHFRLKNYKKLILIGLLDPELFEALINLPVMILKGLQQRIPNLVKLPTIYLEQFGKFLMFSWQPQVERFVFYTTEEPGLKEIFLERDSIGEKEYLILCKN